MSHHQGFRLVGVWALRGLQYIIYYLFVVFLKLIVESLAESERIP